MVLTYIARMPATRIPCDNTDSEALWSLIFLVVRLFRQNCVRTKSLFKMNAKFLFKDECGAYGLESIPPLKFLIICMRFL